MRHEAAHGAHPWHAVSPHDRQSKTDEPRPTPHDPRSTSHDPQAAPDCSIVIPVRGRASLTRQCLDTLLGRPPARVKAEIIVVDDASTDVTPRLLGAYGDRIRVVTHAANEGFARACNDGAALARGRWVVFLNNDTIPGAGWLDALVAYAEAHPAAAVVGAKLLFPNDTIQHAGVVIGQDRNPRHIYAGFPADHPAVNRSRPFQIVTAGCALVRRDIFMAVGGFDTAFVNGYEDVDLCLRLGEAGHEVHYCHESVLYHLESVSEDRFALERHNTRLYRERWAPRVRPDDVDHYLADGLLRLDYERGGVRLTVSPLLAVVDGEGREREADRLLALRSRQVLDLLTETIRLDVRAREAELRAEGLTLPRLAGVPASGSRRPLPLHDYGEGGGRGESEAQLLHRGVIHHPPHGATNRLISILLPTKNGAASLRDSLPRVLGQRVADAIEIVAVDSGSTDDTLDVLREHGATILAIPPATFNHGLTRNLAAREARGDVFVFLNQTALPANDRWLASLVASLRDDPRLAGVASRVLPREGASPLVEFDGLRAPSGSPKRSRYAIDDRAGYEALPPHELRLLINFHTVSAAVRPELFARIPFRRVTIGEDILWAKEVLEAGYAVAHEPDSIVFHSHDYHYLDILARNVDDGLANRAVIGRQLDGVEVVPAILALVRDDWRHLERSWEVDPPDEIERDRRRLSVMLRRTAQVLGQWIGANEERMPGDLVALLSLTERIKTGAPSLSIGSPEL